MHKTISLLLLTTLIITGCTTQNSNTSSSTSSSASTTASGDEKKSGFSLLDVSRHASRADCWMAIEDKVYNVTDFIAQHPGEDEILQGCGKDATSMFNARPSNGLPHSNTAKAMLAGYLIGDLVSK